MTDNHISQEKDVIEKAYEVTTNPEILDKFEEYWEAYMDSLLQNKSSSRIDLKDAPINAHILRAIEIIERMGILKSANSHAQNIVDSNYGIGFIVDKSGNIISKNLDAKKYLGLTNQLSNIEFDEESFADIARWVKQPVDVDKKNVFFRDIEKKPGEFKCFFVTPLKLIDDEVNVNQFHFLIMCLEHHFEWESVEPIQYRYDLTYAETEILLALLNGQNNKEIAAERKVSKTTVDKQVKQIRLKTETRSVVELVRRVGAMAQKISSVEKQVSREAAARNIRRGMVKTSKIILRDSRIYEFAEQGHPRGTPVLNIHTLLSSGRLLPSAGMTCVGEKWRFISPSRHGYGKSDRALFSSVTEMIDKSVDDFCQLLDHLKIDKVIVIDAKYGQRFAVKYPDRVKALICMNTVPIWRPEFLNYLSGRKRNMVKTSIHAPTAVRYLAHVGHLLIKSGRERIFLNGLNKENPTDLAVLENEEIYDVLKFGVNHVVAQGVEGHAWDVRLMHTDQSDDIRRLNVPVSIIYGDKCHTLPDAMVRSYSDLLNDFRVRKVEGAGAYLLHTHFSDVLSELDFYRD